ncbi:MAG TPA: hypothetical protein DEF07_10165 [Nitrosomonas sp.]|nr:hypothetical protein [Nitrosomonas sp.]
MRSLLDGKIDCENARIKVEALSMKEFPDLYANLHHYYYDEDTREKDQQYREFQNNELKKLIMHLEVGDMKRANEISFLHES